MAFGNNQLSVLHQFWHRQPPIGINARIQEIEPGKVVSEWVGIEPEVADVWLFQRHSIDKYAFLDQLDAVSRHADHALHKVLRWVDWIVEHNDVAAANLPVRNDVIGDSASPVTQFIDQEVITDQQRVLHRLGRNLERLHDKGNDEDGDHHGSQQ